jgi:hypothetical protein
LKHTEEIAMPPRWILTEHAIARGAFALRCSHDEAEDRLYEIMARATHRETDRAAQRELYRSPKSDGAMRWVIDVHATPPRVLWVGQSAPITEHWDPEQNSGGERGEGTISVTLDAGALRILADLRSEYGRRDGTRLLPVGDVIGRALRLLHEEERGRR